MKKLGCILWLIVLIFPLNAQSLQNNTKKGLPSFNIQLADGSHFKVTDLKKELPVMIVYFDPDCDHCLIFAETMLQQISAFSNVQIVMVTYVPVQALNSFTTKLNLGKYPQVKAGTEGTTFIVRYHYNVMQFPYVALHDKNGNLFATYETEVPLPMELAEMFSKK